jgi:hypothetical protein
MDGYVWASVLWCLWALFSLWSRDRERTELLANPEKFRREQSELKPVPGRETPESRLQTNQESSDFLRKALAVVVVVTLAYLAGRNS